MRAAISLEEHCVTAQKMAVEETNLSYIMFVFLAAIEVKLKKSITINENRYSQLF